MADEGSGSTTPLRPVSKLFPQVGESITPPGVFNSMTPQSNLPKVDEDDGDGDINSTHKLFDNVHGTILDTDRCLSQVKASESAAVEELALKSFALIDTQEKVLEEKRNLAKAQEEINDLKNVISTMELSIEKHVITCANVNIENKALKAEVRDLKNQLTISRSSHELLIDQNSLLTNEVVDRRRNTQEDQLIIEALRKDLRSYELLHQSQPSNMYSQLMNQSRINLEEENIKLQDRLFMLMSKIDDKKGYLLLEKEGEEKGNLNGCGEDDVSGITNNSSPTSMTNEDDDDMNRSEFSTTDQQSLEILRVMDDSCCGLSGGDTSSYEEEGGKKDGAAGLSQVGLHDSSEVDEANPMIIEEMSEN